MGENTDIRREDPQGREYTIMHDNKLDILFQPLEMSNLRLKNRFFMAPIGTGFHVNRMTDFLVARARGEVALITTGEICVHPSGRAGIR